MRGIIMVDFGEDFFEAVIELPDPRAYNGVIKANAGALQDMHFYWGRPLSRSLK